jgi:hypothetical protein
MGSTFTGRTATGPQGYQGHQGLPGGIDDRIILTLSGGGYPISSDFSIFHRVQFNSTITGAYLLADKVGSIEIDIWFNSSTIPTVADSIVGATPPTLSSEIESEDELLSDWDTVLTEGGKIGFYINSASIITYCELTLAIRRD